jgi:hypothetical protein
MFTYVVEGTVRFTRDPGAHPAGDLCRAQCGPGGHIVSRKVEVKERPLRYRQGPIRCAEAFLHDRVLDDNGNEGRRVRITIEVLD